MPSCTNIDFHDCYSTGVTKKKENCLKCKLNCKRTIKVKSNNGISYKVNNTLFMDKKTIYSFLNHYDTSVLFSELNLNNDVAINSLVIPIVQNTHATDSILFIDEADHYIIDKNHKTTNYRFRIVIIASIVRVVKAIETIQPCISESKNHIRIILPYLITTATFDTDLLMRISNEIKKHSITVDSIGFVGVHLPGATENIRTFNNFTNSKGIYYIQRAI